jgi:hypothetical protein
MSKAFDWKRSRISVLEVEAVPQSCIPEVQIGLSIVLCMRSLLLIESFDFRPSNQYILMRVVPSWIRFAKMKMCLCQISLLSRCSPRYLTSSWAELHVIYMDRGRASFPSCGECDVDRLWIR